MPDLMQPAVDSLPGLARVAASAALHTTEWGVQTSAQGLAARRPRGDQPGGGGGAGPADAGEALAVCRRAGPVGRPPACRWPQALLSAGESLGGLVEQPRGRRQRPGRSSGRDDAHDAARARRTSCSSSPATCGTPTRATRRTSGSSSSWRPTRRRILLLLLEGGPQPSVDVRTGGPIGMVSRQLIAPG